MATDLEVAQNTVAKLRRQLNQLITAGRATPAEIKVMTDALEKAQQDLVNLTGESQGMEVLSWDEDATYGCGPTRRY